MQTTYHRLFEPGRDDVDIRAALADGQRLVACLCAAWCSSCAAWRGAFESLSREFAQDCFVWIDIEDHSDLVAEVEVETLPVLLVQADVGVGFLGPIEPRAPVVRALLMRAAPIDLRLADPGVRDRLLA
ncbi:MAG: thioredoxin family protein [Burkholderiales bacterium]